LKRLLTVFPPDELLQAFNVLAEPLFCTAYNTACECHTLAALRDRLLPKLISGELHVQDAQRIVEQARGIDEAMKHV